jgi:ureidoacrylate peracid hydrolase
MIEPLRTLGEQVAPAHTALLVIDVQNDFCDGDGGLARRGADLSGAQAAVPRLAATMRAAAAAGVLVVALRIVQSPTSGSDAWSVLEAGAEHPLVVEGSWGAEYHPGLPLDLADHEIVKHRHSAFVGTGLDELLRAAGVRTVVLGGVATNVCVEGTAREAADRDFYVVVLDDACAAASPGLHLQALSTVRTYLGRVASSDDVRAHWPARPTATSSVSPPPQEHAR